ncbi:MAG: phosphoribosylanthranilate isomerase [Alphaproteobacteria bacterium]|nr:phosphoribosylanthranilate isomerase [Alphaproteobacteria bacterium]
MVLVKICGLTEPHGLTAAIEGGADFVGFVFHPPSPRAVTPDIARYLASYVPSSVRRVGLFVNPDLELLQQTVQQGFLDMIQLHGDEDTDFINKLKGDYGLPVMKVVNVAAKKDLEAGARFEPIADWMLFDTKTASGSGGTGRTFDWSVLKDYPHQKPWMLAGGLTVDNIAEASRILAPTVLDVSSGVESSRGVKDPGKIRAFLQAAKSL